MKLPTPLSEQLREFHRDHGIYHLPMASEHRQLNHEGAAVRHEQAAIAQEKAMEAPLDQDAVRPAMLRVSAIADEASQRVGVRPLPPWPGKGKR